MTGIAGDSMGLGSLFACDKQVGDGVATFELTATESSDVLSHS